MMEVTIHWTSVPGDGVQRYLVDVPSVGGNARPNPFDAVQADIAINAALHEFRTTKPVVEHVFGGSNREHGRVIRRIELRQTEDVVIAGVGR